MIPQWIIEKKRDGHSLDQEEIRFFINGYTKGTIPDYQMSALAMAIYFKGMTYDETAILTKVMLQSGHILDTSHLQRPVIDKHSTGGIGDKISLILAPLVACSGLAVPMISGRSLGITGGTLDKLESIPGYRTDLSEKKFLGIVDRCGCSIIGQTKRLAPADRKLYALRDVTGTVPSIPLITASILSKKLAEGLDGLVFDVKCGSGAFMKRRDDARALAQSLISVTSAVGTPSTALLTSMDEPLGRTVGNALEIRESVDVLRGTGPADVRRVTLELGARMLCIAGIEKNHSKALRKLQAILESGQALNRFMRMVVLHGGHIRYWDTLPELGKAVCIETVDAPFAGVIGKVDARKIGQACMILGAGRTRTNDVVDLTAGISDLVKIGENIERGQALARLHGRKQSLVSQAIPLIKEAIDILPAPSRVARPQLILSSISSAQVTPSTPRKKKK